MKAIKIAALCSSGIALTVLAKAPAPPLADLPNRLPEAAPYVSEEAAAFPPPYEEYWKTQNHPGQCKTCHQKIFDEWNGSMMSSSWRDPVWRAAFLLLARAVSTNGECDTPAPPDGTEKAKHNPFALPGACASRFDLGTEQVTLSRPGSLLDAFCSRCHMPTNYLDNVPLRTVAVDAAKGLEWAPPDPKFHPTSDNGTGLAFATVDAQLRNTESGKAGIFCAVCHSFAATRDTPYHNYAKSGVDYVPAVGEAARSELLAKDQQDLFGVADPAAKNLGYSIGAGAYRLSPHAIAFPERFGPLAANPAPLLEDKNTSSVFGMAVPYQQIDDSKHKGYHQAMFVRAEMCGACHDVTNALPIKNPLGKWTGAFPIERTYTEWSGSRYAERPGNGNFDPAFKRDCQSCHMQQDFGQPGTAQTLYDENGHPLPIAMDAVASEGKVRPFFTHHFVGGNALVPGLIGKAADAGGSVAPYPELSVYSFSSADHDSPYSRAVWTNVEAKGETTQHARMAWDRLRHALQVKVTVTPAGAAGGKVRVAIEVVNTGAGHNFPTGFPEGRIGWVAVHAYDLATGKELMIEDRHWQRTSLGVGDLTTEELQDPAYPKCHWHLPAGSADPYAVQFKAVASLGDGCPTLDLPYATALNLVTDPRGLPVDEKGAVIDAKKNPRGLPQFRDLDGDGDVFDDAFLVDTRLRPMPHPGARLAIDRYAVVVPAGTRGPIAVSATIYYQSVEAIVAQKFLGNLTDRDNDLQLEPCVLGGLCDGRSSRKEPAVVEGSPPVPMAVDSAVVEIGPGGASGAGGAAAGASGAGGAAAGASLALEVGVYPAPSAPRAHLDTVPKLFFSQPVTGVSAASFTLHDASGAQLAAKVERIGDGTWALFPDAIFLEKGATYTARLAGGAVCAVADGRACLKEDGAWSFTVSADAEASEGDTRIPPGFSGARRAPSLPLVTARPHR